MQLGKFKDVIITSFREKTRLNRRIWHDEELKKSVRRRLLAIAKDYVDFVGINFPIDDVIFTGSMANYDWSEYSDIDLHLVTDFKKINKDKELVQEFFNAKKALWKETHDITIYDYDVELYVQDKNEDAFSTGVYSLKHEKWLVKPEQKGEDVAEVDVKHKAEHLMKEIDELASYAKHPSQKALDKIEELKDRIKKMRVAGLSARGEYSTENLAFKYLRRTGYLEKLSDLKSRVYDQLRSI